MVNMWECTIFNICFSLLDNFSSLASKSSSFPMEFSCIPVGLPSVVTFIN